jgi:Mg2+ and Co2+ transporter CorA
VFIRDLETCLEGIRKINQHNQIVIESLKKENSELKEKHYKDTEMKDMKHRLDKMQKDYWRGFPISEEEQKAIKDWKRKHDEQDHGYTPEIRMKAEGCSGGRYKYVFVPTSLGVSGRIVCHCGVEFEFQEIG